MPNQIKRLFIFLMIFGSFFVFVRRLFVPISFGEIGHYRALALDEIADHDIKYAGHQICAECHDDIAEKKSNSYHKSVNCEVCHGPGMEHIESGAEILPDIPRERGYCSLCHEYNPARPTGFAQIDPILHNPTLPCIKCHDSHAPDPPEIPDNCSACHNRISRTKAVSPHALLDCQDCHETPQLHRSQPGIHKSGFPVNRSDCLKCHAEDADADRFIPRVEKDTHGESYLCWQCHYPHFPEAR